MIEELDMESIIPKKKPLLEMKQLFGQSITVKEFDDEIFKFVRGCRYEADCNNPTFFDNLTI